MVSDNKCSTFWLARAGGKGSIIKIHPFSTFTKRAGTIMAAASTTAVFYCTNEFVVHRGIILAGENYFFGEVFDEFFVILVEHYYNDLARGA